MTKTLMNYLPKQATQFAQLFCLALLLCLLTFPGYSQETEFAINAISSNDQPEFHKVKRGETLYGISRQYDISVKEIKELNKLRGDLIFPGQSLLVEKSGSSRSKTNAREVAPRSSAPAEVASSSTYDQPTSLDDMFKETVAVNSTPASVTPFRQLGSRAAVPAKSRETSAAQIEKKVYYEVKPGDNIYTIADEYSVLVAEIREWNAVTEVNEGQTIIVQKIYQPVPLEQLKGRTTNTYTPSRNVSRSVAPAASSRRNSPVMKGTTQSRSIVAPNKENVSTGSSYRRSSSSMTHSTYESRATTTSQRSTAPSHWSNQGYTKLLEEGNRNAAAKTNSRSTVNASSRRSTDMRTQTRSVDSESGKYGKIDDPAIPTRFYGIHKTLPIGSTFKLGIPNNSGFVEVEVVGRLNPRSRAMIGLSPACITILEGAGAKGTATLIYE